MLGSAYFYTYALMQLPTGLMADSWGPRRTVSSFFLIAGIGSILMGMATTLPLAIFGRVLVGLGVSTVFVCNFKLLSEWFDARQFLIMGSAFMVMGGIGALSASAPLAWASDVFGWRLTLIGVGGVSLLMAVLVFAFVRNRPADMGLPPIKKASSAEESRIGVMAGMKMVLSSGRFWPVSIWAFCVIGVSFAVGGLWGGPYLMQVYGLSKAAAGGVLSTYALSMILGSPLLGWLGNRLGRKPVLLVCSGLMLLACTVLTVFVTTLPLPLLYCSFFLLFFTGGASGPVVATMSKELFPLSISGTSIGTVNLFPFAGGAFFQVLIGAVLTANSLGQSGYAPAGFRWMFLCCLAGALVSLAATCFMQETLLGKTDHNPRRSKLQL